MITSGSNAISNVCDLKYLNDMMGLKKHLVKGIMDVFLKQIPEELQSIDNAITKTDFATIKDFAHTMKSSVAIMGISVLAPILSQMENLGTKGIELDQIKDLNLKLNTICKQAIQEIEREKINYGK